MSNSSLECHFELEHIMFQKLSVLSQLFMPSLLQAARCPAFQETPGVPFSDFVLNDLPSLCFSTPLHRLIDYLSVVQLLCVQYIVWLLNCYFCVCAPQLCFITPVLCSSEKCEVHILEGNTHRFGFTVSSRWLNSENYDADSGSLVFLVYPKFWPYFRREKGNTC